MILFTADKHHLSDIRNIAFETWPVAYREILSDDQLQYMLDLFYSIPSLEKQLISDHRFRICESGGKSIGFSSVSLKENDPAILRLNKLYVLPGTQGKGAGKLLLDDVKQYALRENLKAVELNVNRNNKARFFYEKEGFVITNEVDIAIGEGFYMNDFIMTFFLNPLGSLQSP